MRQGISGTGYVHPASLELAEICLALPLLLGLKHTPSGLDAGVFSYCNTLTCEHQICLSLDCIVLGSLILVDLNMIIIIKKKTNEFWLEIGAEFPIISEMV